MQAEIASKRAPSKRWFGETAKHINASYSYSSLSMYTYMFQ